MNSEQARTSQRDEQSAISLGFDALPMRVLDAALERINQYIRRTPCTQIPSIGDEMRLFVKCENEQMTGSFKARGASNAVLSLSPGQAAAGVVTHSSGNHGAALAWAATLIDVPAHIVMPSNSRPQKIANVQRHKTNPIFCGTSTQERSAAAAQVQQETGACMVHPYDQWEVIAGQSTVAAEIIEQLADVDCIVVPVGGGGLLSGTLARVKQQRPEIRVFAAEPAWADDASRSLQKGTIQSPTRYDTIADGLRTQLGTKGFPIIQQHLDELFLVSESSIKDHAQQLTGRLKTPIEPSAAITVAAIKENPVHFENKTVVAILSGGNV